MKYLYILLLFLFSCSQQEIKDVKSDKKNTGINDMEFESFLKLFPQIKLPVFIEGCKINAENLHYFSDTTSSAYVETGSYAYGQFKSNGNYKSVITLGIAECLLPEIITYSLNGHIIDRKTIAIGYCGDEPCFECLESMTLNQDFTIYTADTMITSKCDEDFNPILGTETMKIIFKEGKLTEDGIIKLSNIIAK